MIVTIYNNILFAVLPPQGILESRSDEPIRYMRTHFTVYQRRELEKTFSQSKYISPRKRQSLSEGLGISEGIIQVKGQVYFFCFILIVVREIVL